MRNKICAISDLMSGVALACIWQENHPTDGTSIDITYPIPKIRYSEGFDGEKSTCPNGPVPESGTGCPTALRTGHFTPL